MGRRAEAEDADRLRLSGGLQRAPADEPGAEERRGRDRIEPVLERKRESGVGDRVGREAAVAGVAGEDRLVAEILTRAQAKRAVAAGVAEPGYADTGPEREADALARRLDPADDLMARHNRRLDVGQFAVDHVQVGAADAAGLDPHANLPRPGHRIRPLLHREPLAGPLQNHGVHGVETIARWRGAELAASRKARQKSLDRLYCLGLSFPPKEFEKIQRNP